MQWISVLPILAAVVLSIQQFTATAQETLPIAAETLINSPLARLENTEAILSHVNFEPGALLPRHWHPGEEFAYVVAGSATFMMDGSEPMEMTVGSTVMIPPGRIHSARAGADGIELVVFRVHETGQPERILIED